MGSGTATLLPVICGVTTGSSTAKLDLDLLPGFGGVAQAQEQPELHH